MKVIDIYLNNQLIDGISDVDIQMQYSLKQVQEPSETTSAYSLDFEIPGTSINNQIFEHIYEINSQTNYNPNGNNVCELRVNGLSIFVGKMQLNGISKKKIGENEEIIYNVTLYNWPKSLFIDIRGKLLTDLDFRASKYSFDPTDFNIRHTWNHPDSATSPFWCYFGLIDYNYNLDFDLAFSYPNNTKMTSSDLYPSVFNKVIFDRIFEEHGYKYKSEFLNSSAFTRTIIPYSNPDPVYCGAMLSAYCASDVNIATVTNPIFENEHYDTFNVYDKFPSQVESVYDYPTSQWVPINLTNVMKFVAPKTGTYYVNFRINWQQISNSTMFALVKTTDAATAGETQATWVLTNTNFYMFGQLVSMSCGEQLYLSTYPWAMLPASGNIKAGSTMTVSWGDSLDIDTNVHLGDCLPVNVTISDYLNGLNKLYNLYWESDKDDPTTILIEPYESFFSQTGTTTWDWNNRVDADYEIDFFGDISNSIVNFKYQDGSGYLEEEYKKKNTLEYGQKQVIFTGNCFTEPAEVNVEANPFQASVVGGVNSGSATNMKTPKYLTDSHTFSWDTVNTDIGLRILYAGGLVNCDKSNPNGFYFKFNDAGFSRYPYCGHELYMNDPTNPNNKDLNYESKNLYYEQTPTNKNLYELFWRSYYNNFNEKENRLIIITVRLSETDIYLLRLNDTIFFKEGIWRINLLKYNVGEDLHEIELIKVIDDLYYTPSSLNSKKTFTNLTPSFVGVQGNSIIKGTNVISIGNNNAIGTGASGDTTQNVINNGVGNFVGGNTSNINVFGNNNIINSGVTGTTIFGDNVTVSQGQSNSIIFNNNVVFSGTVDFDSSIIFRGSGNKRNIRSGDTIVVSADFQYLIYDRLTNEGNLIADGQVLVENGGLTINGNGHVVISGDGQTKVVDLQNKAENGLILGSPGGNIYNIQVDDAGGLVATLL